jgi:hypothetical protein
MIISLNPSQFYPTNLKKLTKNMYLFVHEIKNETLNPFE